ncbi:hypothetical protein B0H66DRAFT_466065 [Apodospora peruviana]|uniref:5'-3' DNA helicase ZGRF1-like N-terminal domain-containing protein n=1 Tax=Apodospora peruviana TaxID=516989 RepID=A0AAE0IU25_9PEZI|nr:hypothetical protein B0H66DRAFT_466065 [Apodospora peruviana]
MATLTSSGSAPGTHDRNAAGSSAPVLEFLCLFTHDIRRKQKRWQDGRLKYHLFNKRVMVYDDRGNFVGDMHWRRDWELDEGEEVELERGGIIVQVAECVGRQNQDLSELLDKRAIEKEQRAAVRPAVVPVPMHTPLSVTRPRPQVQDHFQTRHRPLNALLGTPSGHHGRAVVPAVSPFEQRHAANETPDRQTDSRPTKRTKYDDLPSSKMGYAQSLFGAPLSLSGVPMSSAPTRRAPKPQPRVEIPPSPEEVTQNPVVPMEPVGEAAGQLDRRSRMSNTNVVAGLQARHSGADTAPRVTSRHFANDQADTLADSGPVIAEEQQQTELPGVNGLGHRNPAPASRTAPWRTELPKPTKATPVMQRNAANPFVRQNPEKFGNNQTRDISGPSNGEEIIILDDDREASDQAEETPVPRKAKPNITSKRTASDVQPQRNVRRKKSPLPPRASPSRMESGLKDAPPRDLGTETGSEAAQKEPRTELRLKSRQKRGLLVMSEMAKKSQRKKAQRASSQPTQKAPGTSGPSQQDKPPRARSANHDAVENSALATSGTLRKSPKTTTERPKTADSVYDIPENTNDEHIHQESPSPGRAAKPKKPVKNGEPATRKAKSVQAKMVQPDPEPRSRNHLLRTSTRLASKVSHRENQIEGNPSCAPVEQISSDGNPEEDLPHVPVGPRLVKLGNRSVKSREIIGFVMSSSPVLSEPDTPSSPPRPEVNKDSFQVMERPDPIVETREDALTAMQNPSPMPNTRMDARTNMADSLKTSTPNGTTPSLQRHNSLPERRECSSIQDTGRFSGASNSVGQLPSRVSLRSGLNRAKSAVTRAEIGGVVDVHPLATGSDLPNAAPVGDAASTTVSKNLSPVENQTKASGGGLHSESHKLPDSLHRGQQPSVIRSLEKPAAAEAGPIRSVVPTEATTGTGTNPPPPPRIVNPATRGRKAALKSHAAGQTPQSVLPPPDPLADRSVNLLRGSEAASRPAVAPAAAAGGNERPKRKMTFPGFASVKEGGPWSREAHDLLETGRPR